MRDNKVKKNHVPYSVKFPIIKDKNPQMSGITMTKGIKLEKIGQKKNLMLMDIAKINKI